jgi:hypothetical protein
MKAVCFSNMLASTYEPTQRQIPKHHYHYHTHRCENLKDLMVGGTGSGSCLLAGSGISGVEPSGSAAKQLVQLQTVLEYSETVNWNEYRKLQHKCD